jgi:hypothetical protein
VSRLFVCLIAAAMATFANAEPQSVAKTVPSKRHMMSARRSAVPRSLDDLDIRGDMTDEEYRRWRERNQGLAIPPVEVGQPMVILSRPQQPHWQNRATMTVGPDQQNRDTIPRTSKDDGVPYPSQGKGVDLTIRPGAVVFSTARLQGRAIQSHQHDRRAWVTASPSGLPMSELATLVPAGILSRGQNYNAMNPDAGTQSVELSMDFTGVHALINRSDARIPAHTPMAAVLPRRMVATPEDKQRYMAGNAGVVPGPTMKTAENIKNEFELDLVPVPMNIFHRNHDVLFTLEMRPYRLGFTTGRTEPDGTYFVSKKDYDPQKCLAVLRGIAYADVDARQSAILLDSEGLEAQFCNRMLSFAVGLLLTNPAAGPAVDVKDAKDPASEWRKEAETICGRAARRQVTLVQFINGRKGESGMTTDGAIALLARFKAGWNDNTFGLGENLKATDAMRFAAAGLDSALALWNAGAHQMYMQTMGGVFCISITPALSGGELEVNLV